MPEPLDEQRLAELTAYLDGELEDRDARALETRLREDPTLRAEADTLRRTWGLLDFLPQPEPSATFAERTLDKLAVVRPAWTVAAPAPPAETPTRNPWPMRLALAAAALAVFIAGYGVPGLFQEGPRPLNTRDRDDQMARDLRVIDNLTLYQHGEDLEFLTGLDHPDLFGE